MAGKTIWYMRVDVSGCVYSGCTKLKLVTCLLSLNYLVEKSHSTMFENENRLINGLTFHACVQD